MGLFIPDGDNIKNQQSQNTATQTPAFSDKDPAIIGNALAGMIPGGHYVANMVGDQMNRSTNPTQNNSNTLINQLMGLPQAMGGDVVNMVKNTPQFLAGSVYTPALTLADLLGPIVAKGYKPYDSVHFPLLGEQSSFQKQQQDLQNQGAGKVLSTAFPIVQWLSSVLGTHKAINSIENTFTPDNRSSGEQLKDYVDKNVDEATKNRMKSMAQAETRENALVPDKAPSSEAPSLSKEANSTPLPVELMKQASLRAQGIVYRAVDSNDGKATLGNGSYFSFDKDNVSRYGKDVRTFKLDPNANMLDLSNPADLTSFTQKLLSGGSGKGFQQFVDLSAKVGSEKALGTLMTNFAKSKGYDGIIGDDKAFGSVVFDKSNLIPLKNFGISVGGLQQLVEPADLATYEDALNSNNYGTIAKLSLKYPADARFQVHETLGLDKPVSDWIKENVPNSAGEENYPLGYTPLIENKTIPYEQVRSLQDSQK